MRKRRFLRSFYLSLLLLLPAAVGARTPAAVWQVTRSTDPITGASSCIVAAWDRASGVLFSRTGALYPFAENSSTHGLLVGVSSGGRFRVPTGDILWRVDDRPYRTLSPSANPQATASANPVGAPAAYADLMEEQMRLITAATATSTVASGEQARQILEEMLAGRGLVFRSATATAGYGLPTGADQQVGQVTKDGPRPYPIDDSFRSGLAACGISGEPGH